MKEIAPMTAPNAGSRTKRPIGGVTPEHYDAKEAPKRSFQLSVMLADVGYKEEKSKILSHVLAAFPYGDRTQHGSQCAEAGSMIATL